MQNYQNNQQANKALSPTMKIVLTAMLVALSTIINAYVTIRIGTEFKFSFLLLVYFISGYILGAPLGFVVGIVGDLLGWILFTDGAYNPIIGLSNGLFAFIPGIVFGLKRPFKKEVKLLEFVVKTLICYLLSYLLCTVLLTSIGSWIYSSYLQGKYGTLMAWFLYRAVAQLPNTLINLALTIAIFLPLKRVKALQKYL